MFRISCGRSMSEILKEREELSCRQKEMKKKEFSQICSKRKVRMDPRAVL